VRKYVYNFISEAERRGVMPTARSYGVEGQVRELMEVRKELNISELEPSECVAGSRVVKILRDLGVDETKYSDFIHASFTGVVEQGLKPREFVNSCYELRRLRQQTGKGYQEILNDYEAKQEVNTKLKAENTQLEEKRRQVKNQLLQEIREKDTTLETLKWFDETRDTLRGYTVEVEQLDKLATLLMNVSEKSYNPDDVIEFYSTTRDLEEYRTTLDSTIARLTTEEAALKERNLVLTKTITDNQKIVESITEIDALDLSVQNIGELTHKVTEISSLYGMDKKQALEKFFSNIDAQYEAKLGYENELNRLQARKSRLSDELTHIEANLRRLENVYAEKKGILDKLDSLNGRGVKNENLIHWDEILAETEIDLITVRREISQLGGLRQWFDEKNKDKKKLEGEVEALTREIDTLKIQKENYEAELKALTTGALAEAKREIKRLPGIIDDLRRDLLDPETGLKTKSLEMIDNTHDKIQKQLNKKEESWTKLFNEAEEKVEEINSQVNHILAATYEAGKMVGQYKALEPVHRLEAGEDVPRYIGLNAIYRTTIHFRNWFKKQALMECLTTNNRLIDLLDQELRNPG
jgi:DNA repair exonuclease SbcCD ATPase subunit